MDYSEVRGINIEMHNLRGMDNEYIFYYDETNNIRKLHLREDGLNVKDPGNFVLAGLVFEGHSFDKDVSELLKELRLQKTVKEIKFNLIASGEFENIINSRKLGIILDWINANNICVHYFNMDVFYWSIVDIVDSVIIENAREYISLNLYIKDLFYRVILSDRSEFISGMNSYGYPNISKDNASGFTNWIIGYFRSRINVLDDYSAEMLRQFLRKMEMLNDYAFLGEDKENVLIDTFSDFYFKKIYMYNKSKHIFDQEAAIQNEVGGMEFIVNGQLLNNYSFIDSKSDIMIQLSDVMAGLFGKYFTFIRQSNAETLSNLKHSYNPIQLHNHKAMKILIDRSDCLSNGFIHNIVSLKDLRKNDYFYNDVQNDKNIQ